MSDPHGRPAKGAVASVAQVLWYLLTAWPAWWRHVAPARRRGDWVLLDRCFLDLACDPRRYRYGGPLWFARAAQVLMPRPDRLLVLVAAPDAILARKREVEQAELARQLLAYRRAASAHGGLLIAVDGAPEAVAERAASLLGLER